LALRRVDEKFRGALENFGTKSQHGQLVVQLLSFGVGHGDVLFYLVGEFINRLFQHGDLRFESGKPLACSLNLFQASDHFPLPFAAALIAFFRGSMDSPYLFHNSVAFLFSAVAAFRAASTDGGKLVVTVITAFLVLQSSFG
jgi:hypothetical protein